MADLQRAKAEEMAKLREEFDAQVAQIEKEKLEAINKAQAAHDKAEADFAIAKKNVEQKYVDRAKKRSEELAKSIQNRKRKLEEFSAQIRREEEEKAAVDALFSDFSRPTAG
jgi:hypothetical protein